ncbi:hypothetical protein SDC9_139176 [bioreactor metagenome]|uniref:Uncharacterized protein n=1 Tax=bioreactor metagenome TaxID=1076179 RepID=A0A645DUL5_9ZZZZ
MRQHFFWIARKIGTYGAPGRQRPQHAKQQPIDVLMRDGGQHLRRRAIRRCIVQQRAECGLQRVHFGIELRDFLRYALGPARRARSKQHQPRCLHVERRERGIASGLGRQRTRQQSGRRAQRGQQLLQRGGLHIA